MLIPGMIKMSDKEREKVETLLSKNGGREGSSVTREGPNETGDLLVTTSDGKEHRVKEA